MVKMNLCYSRDLSFCQLRFVILVGFENGKAAFRHINVAMDILPLTALQTKLPLVSAAS